MSITYVRLSTSSNVREKLDMIVQESGKSIDEIVNLALEKYLKSGYNLPTSKDIKNNKDINGYDNDESLSNSAELNTTEDIQK